MTDAIPRWKVFPREIESDLSLYHGIDIGEWHEGRLSSRRMLVLLDGLPPDCWYKCSVTQFQEEIAEEAEYEHGYQVSSLIWSQLSGQTIEVPDTT